MTVEAQIRVLVERLVAAVQELLRVEFLRGFGLVGAVSSAPAEAAPPTTPNKPRRTGRAPSSTAKTKARAPKARISRMSPKTEPARERELIDSPELPSEQRVLAIVRDNAHVATITSATIANALGIEAGEARSMITRLVKSARLMIVGDRNNLPKIVLVPSG